MTLALMVLALGLGGGPSLAGTNPSPSYESFEAWQASNSPGPVEECCLRRIEMCEAICPCGVYQFFCWDNGRGSCSSNCRCILCPY
jgi:hypothetical protein